MSKALFRNIANLATDRKGNLYIADTNSNSIKEASLVTSIPTPPRVYLPFVANTAG